METLPKRVGFLVKTWPKLSETFILEEVLGLERLGQPLAIFALNPSGDGMRHEAVQRVRAPVSYLAPPSGGLCAELACHLRLLCAAPRRYLSAAARAARRAEPGRIGDFRRGARLAEALRQQGITHLHAHFVSEPAAVAEIGAAIAGAGYSLSAHAKDIYLSTPAVLARKLAGAHFTVTCTEYNRHHLAWIAPSARLMRMYHGVDLERFHPRLRQPAEGIPLILGVGRLREKKGFATLIDACARLRDAGRLFRCEIVGYGEESDALAQRISEKGLDGCVILAGKLARDQVIERYARASVFVLPSQLASDGDRDGIPNVLLEAMAMQVPVVSTPVSGIPELVQDGQNGLLVEPGDALGFADAIAALISNPALSHRLGAAARLTVTHRFDNQRNLLLLRDALGSCPVPASGQGRRMPSPGAAHAR